MRQVGELGGGRPAAQPNRLEVDKVVLEVAEDAKRIPQRRHVRSDVTHFRKKRLQRINVQLSVWKVGCKGGNNYNVIKMRFFFYQWISRKY